MRHITARRLSLVVAAVLTTSSGVQAGENRDLKVHVAQANNDSPYVFVRAKFEPGELSDPWAVRFFDQQGAEVPYFVWDSVTWQVARDGRADWGHRYALINHATGNTEEVRQARQQKLQAACQGLPLLGAKLAVQEEMAQRAGNSVCAAMYLLRHHSPAFGKQRLSLRVYPERQVEPRRRQWQGPKVDGPISAQQGELEFRNLPDRLAVTWKGKELFRGGGFDAGGAAGAVSHAEPSRPYNVETCEGIITKLVVTGQTTWRQDGTMEWQCTYWLFPEGGYVGREGFSLGQASQYLGGPQKLTVFATEQTAGFAEKHEPDWERPWWVHQAGEDGFVASHLFFATPLSIGYGNNPFTVNAEGPNKDPRVEADGQQLGLRWFHEVNDPAISRLMAPQPMRRPNDPPAPPGKPPAWDPKVDWLYRQYVLGVGEGAEAAEAALRSVLGAAAGWIDRPAGEEELASLLVAMMPDISRGGQSSEIGLLKIVPAVMADDQAAVQQAMRDRTIDVVARTDYYISAIRQSVAQGMRPAGGSKLLPSGTRLEGWTGNPCYHAHLMPCYVRVLEFFELPFAQDASHNAILRYADFGLELLGGNPVDFERFRTTLEAEWPSRVVPTIPLMLHAYTLKREEKYARAAQLLFADLLRLVERNPHGYFPAWTFNPKADKYDTVYNPVSYDRGITSLWSEETLDLVGRDAAARFTAAQARWFVFSGQLLDTLEMDNVTAIRACTHGGHTFLRNQISVYLYDDFDFYRGLLGDLIAWSAAASQVPAKTDHHAGTGPERRLVLSDAGSPILRWALDIRPGIKWLDSKVQPLAGEKGFRLQAWNRLPGKQPTVKVLSRDAGMKGDDEVLHVQLLSPAYRRAAEFEVTRSGDRLTFRTNKRAKIRLFYRTLCADWPKQAKPVLTLRRADGRSDVVRDAVQEDGAVQWLADAGQYELSIGKR